MTKIATLLLASSMLTFAGAAVAQESFIDEARFGGTWAQPEWLDNNHTEGDQAGLNGQVFFKPINTDFFGMAEGESSGFWYDLTNPRPTIGAMVSLDKHGTSYVHTGLTWHFNVTETFFIEGTFGGAWNNGSKVPTATRAGIGSKLAFHEAIGLGINIDENWTAVVQWDHVSHRDLGGDMNRGLNNISARLGYKF